MYYSFLYFAYDIFIIQVYKELIKMEIFDGVIAVFDFIYSVFDTIINGITGITNVIFNVISLINNVVRVLPTPLYYITIAYVSVFSVYFVYKLIRKG